MEPQACPYLDTVERKRLDFDMDRICSVTLTAHNVYACLTCGLFFAGRGRATPAYAHALSAGHHVWVGVTPPEGAATAGGVSSGWRPRFWCLPDGYEVVDASLEDVATALRPTFSGSALRALDASPALSRDAAGAPYLALLLGLR